MKTLYISEDWFKKLIPTGIVYPSSTVISGEGGTGKLYASAET